MNTKIDTYWIIRVLVACFVAEAVFLLVQIIVSISMMPIRPAVHELVSAGSPLYQMPPHFIVVALCFFIMVMIGELRNITQAFYYMVGGVIVALIYHLSMWLGGVPTHMMIFVGNIVAALLSGLTYWWVSQRNKIRRT